MTLSAIVFLGLQVGVYYYLWRRFAVDTQLRPPWQRAIGVVLVGLGIGSILTLLAARWVSPVYGQTVGWPVFLWMATLLLMTTLFALVDVTRVSWRGTKALFKTDGNDGPLDPDRRAFVNRIVGGSVAAGAVSFTGCGTVVALGTPPIKDIPIELGRFPAHLDGFTMLQLTDIHVGNTISREFVENVVARTNSAKPDLIAITGDLVDGSVADLADAVAPLADLKAQYGVYFVTGNHEYYSGADDWVAHVRSLGIRVLRNERVRVGGEDGFDLAGVDDHDAGRWPGHGPNLAKAVHGRDPNRELVVLAHQPRQIHESVKHGAGLQLSGHTHGGQIWPWHYLAMAQQNGLLAGHSYHGNTQLYISRGTGHWGPPVRLFAPAEISRVILRSARLRSHRRNKQFKEEVLSNLA